MADHSMRTFAKAINQLGTETSFEVMAQVNALKAQGKDIVSFCIGEPDFDTPAHIKEAAKRALDQGYTHYNPSPGLPEARAEFADYISKTRGIVVLPEEVVITPGAKPIIFFAILACVDQGDEVIYPSPGFPIYESMIDFVGGKGVPVPLLEERGFNFDPADLEKRITPKTKMIILNSPGNPTGGVISSADLEKVAALAIKHDLWVMADEIYSRIIYDKDFSSIIAVPGMKERTILIDGHSKAYAMTGWRLGYGVMPNELAAHLARLMTNSNSCTSTFTQLAGIAAYRGPQEETERMVQEFKARRDLIVEGLNAIPGFRCLKPEGAFYVFPNVTKACRESGFRDSKEFQEYLLQKAGVAVLARTCFGRKNAGETEEYIRFSYATSRENIKAGLRRINKALTRS